MQKKNEDHETKKKILSEGPNANAGAWIRISRRKTQRARIMVRWGLGVGVEEGVDNGLDEGVEWGIDEGLDEGIHGGSEWVSKRSSMMVR